MLSQQYALHPLIPEETQTCHSLLQHPLHQSRLTLMPTHHITPYGDLAGFQFSCAASASAQCLPISRTMFYGHTMVECHENEEAIWHLILNQRNNTERMKRFLETIESRSNPAVLSYSPEYSGYMNTYHNKEILTKDSGYWTPEVPDSIGIYHAMVRGYNREVREHKLYLICSGGLPKACDEFCNLLIDVGGKCNAHTAAISEEAWWLKRACRRSRCRLLYDLAKEFSLNITSIEDIQAKNTVYLAAHTLDTIEHDLLFDEIKQRVTIVNECTDTSRVIPGVLTKMHPAEGYWLFRNGHHNNMKINDMGAFPTTQPLLEKAKFSVPVYTGSNKVVGENLSIKRQHYMCFDENYLQMLGTMGWDRNYGITELMPIVVGVNQLH